MHTAAQHQEFPAEAAAKLRQCWLKTPLGKSGTTDYFFAPARAELGTRQLATLDAGTTMYLTNGNPPELQHVCAPHGSYATFTLHHSQPTAVQLLSKLASIPQVSVIELIKQQATSDPWASTPQQLAGGWEGRVFAQPDVSASDRAALVWAAVVECTQQATPLSDYSSSGEEERTCSSEYSSGGEEEPSPPASPPVLLNMAAIAALVPTVSPPAAAPVRAPNPTDVEQICALTERWVTAKRKAGSASSDVRASEYAAADQIRLQIEQLGAKLERWGKEWLWHKRGSVGIVGGAVFETDREGRICKGLPTDAELEAVFYERQQARSEFDFERADDLRKHLKQLGVSVDDERGSLNGYWTCLDGRSGDFLV